MNVRKMTKDELEQLSFTDIGYNIIKLDKGSKTTVQLFKEICSLLGLSDKEYEDKIADFFTSLTVDKRFILLNSTNWDLKENHSIKTIIDDSEDEYDDIDEEIDELDETLSDKEDEEVSYDDEEIDDIDSEETDDIDELDEMEDIDDIELTEEAPEE
jgi:DNA-directed RNA polymerase subunit delta